MISNLKPSKFRPARIRWVHRSVKRAWSLFVFLIALARLLPAVWFYVASLTLSMDLVNISKRSFCFLFFPSPYVHITTDENYLK
ncbi:hypothetical protein F4804DRAFT_202395 [Jackrogersella minutella]|nr:hypothetical protein F4804DRAFT_202395 [Jackrogersella minutella]